MSGESQDPTLVDRQEWVTTPRPSDDARAAAERVQHYLDVRAALIWSESRPREVVNTQFASTVGRATLRESDLRALLDTQATLAAVTAERDTAQDAARSWLSAMRSAWAERDAAVQRADTAEAERDEARRALLECVADAAALGDERDDLARQVEAVRALIEQATRNGGMVLESWVNALSLTQALAPSTPPESAP